MLLLAIAVLPLCACFIEPTVASREAIEESLAQHEGEYLGYKYVASYLQDYGIGLFDQRKMRNAELRVLSFFAYELPPIKEIAKNTTLLFLEYFYDEIDRTDEEAVTDAILKCYMASLGDRYAVYRNDAESDDYHTDMSGSFVGIGVEVNYTEENRILVVKVIDGSPAEEAGILAQDYITAVNGVRVEEVGYAASVNLIRGEEGTDVEITLSREGKELTVVATRRRVVEALVGWDINDEKIGYIEITGFQGLPNEEHRTAAQFKAALEALLEQDVRGIIFDVRDNPGGYLSSVIEVLDCFVPKNTPIVSYAYKGETPTFELATDDDTISVPVVVLCNENTASAGELFTAAIRDYREMGLLKATIVGKTTYGKGVMQSEFSLSQNGSSSIIFTTAFYNPPSGANYDGEGITPDVEAELEEDFDTQLASAIFELKLLIAGIYTH